MTSQPRDQIQRQNQRYPDMSHKELSPVATGRVEASGRHYLVGHV
jgi:hypothetical protein